MYTNIFAVFTPQFLYKFSIPIFAFLQQFFTLKILWFLRQFLLHQNFCCFYTEIFAFLYQFYTTMFAFLQQFVTLKILCFLRQFLLHQNFCIFIPIFYTKIFVFLQQFFAPKMLFFHQFFCTLKFFLLYTKLRIFENSFKKKIGIKNPKIGVKVDQ